MSLRQQPVPNRALAKKKKKEKHTHTVVNNTFPNVSNYSQSEHF